MTQPLPDAWAKNKQVPTQVILIKGTGGNTVATINVVGTAIVTPAYPYSYKTT